MTRQKANSRRFQLIAIAAAALAIVVGAVVLFHAASDDGPAQTPSQRFAKPLDPAVASEVGTLAKRGDGAGLVDLYARWADQRDRGPARARILDALITGLDRRAGLEHAMQAIGRVPGPIADDPMVEYASEQFQGLWDDPTIYKYGRDLMLVQKSDKARAVLVTSLSQHAARLTEVEDPEHQERSWLTNDLVDLYPSCGDEAKTFVLVAVQELGGEDVAKALTGGTMPADFETVQHQVDEMARAAEQLRAEGGGAGPDREAIMRQLSAP